jgi:hypothetical protein
MGGMVSMVGMVRMVGQAQLEAAQRTLAYFW